MKKLLFAIIATSTLFSCGETAPTLAPETIITGVISNPDGNSVWIENYKNEKIKIDTLNEKGEFEIKFTLSESTCYELVNGKSRTYLCLAPADTLSVAFDSKNISQSIVYSGKGVSFNNYLCEKQKSIDHLMNGEYDSLYYLSADTFLLNSDVLLGLINAPFVALKNDTNVNKSFIAKEEEALKYEKAALLLDYNYYHKMMRMVDTIAGLHKVLALTKEANPNNAAALELKSYRNFLQSYINFNAEEVYKADSTLLSDPINGMTKAKTIIVDKLITDAAVKSYLQEKIKASSPAM